MLSNSILSISHFGIFTSREEASFPGATVQLTPQPQGVTEGYLSNYGQKFSKADRRNIHSSTTRSIYRLS